MFRLWTMTLLATAALLPAVVADAETYYVDGRWDGPTKGTAEAPFNTLGQAVEAYVAGNGHVIKVAGGIYTSTKAGGAEDFGEDGYDLKGKAGAWRGGYAGWREGGFDWSEQSRAYPGYNASVDDVDERAMTVVDLGGAGSRAFIVATYSVSVDFEGFVFRNSEVTRDGYDGGALVVSGGMAGSSVNHCLFYNNRTTGSGGALKLSGRGGVSVNCTFINNRGGNGGGQHQPRQQQPDHLRIRLPREHGRESRRRALRAQLHRHGRPIALSGQSGAAVRRRGFREWQGESVTLSPDRQSRRQRRGGRISGPPRRSV